MVVRLCRPRNFAPVIRLMVVLAITADTRWPRGVSECKTMMLPCPAYVSTFGWFLDGVRRCKSKKCLHSVSLRIFVAMNPIPFGDAIESCSSGSSSSSMVDIRSSISLVGSLAKKIVSSLGARQSAVCRYAGVKDCCNRVPTLRASQTP